MVKSRRHRSRKRSRKRRGGLVPSEMAKCKKAGVNWMNCAQFITKAKVAAAAAAKAQNFGKKDLPGTVAQAAALNNVGSKLKKLGVQAQVGHKLAQQGVKDVETRTKLAKMRVRSDSSGGRKRRRKSRKLKKRRKSKSKRRRKGKSKRRRKSRKTKRRKRRKSRKSRSRKRRR